MSDENKYQYSEEELNQQHKKERKELQAQIQNLKKSICKGDKKRKKELTEELVKLETELDKKQNDEIAQFKLNQLKIESEQDKADVSVTTNKIAASTDKEVSKVKVTKAQKRREKKENAEKERNQKILEQEELNINGKRNIEIQTINKILLDRNLMIHEIPSDGHCLYNAVAHQLQLIGHVPILNFHQLREKTALYLKENSDDFLPFIHNPDSDELLSSEQYEKYCDKVAESSAWGGDIELQVLSRVLKCPIEIIQANGVVYIVGDEFDLSRKLILTYHRHMYHLGAHYNSAIKHISNCVKSS